MGWPTHVGKQGTEPELSASYLARLYLLARTSESFRGSLGYREWVSREKKEYRDRLSIVMGPRPVLLKGNLKDVSVIQIIPRPR